MEKNVRFTNAIDKSGMTLTFIANKSGINYFSLCRVYRGECSLKANVASKVAPIIGKRIDDLIG